MEIILEGANILFNWQSLIYLISGLIGGFIVGALPGFAAATAAALLVPFSIGLSLEHGLLLVVGVYAGSQFAGAVPAILINIPGDAGTAATALDGYPMAQQGKAMYAIGVARIASAFGGVFAGTIVILIIGPLASAALVLGPREMFIIALLALSILTAIVGSNVMKSSIAALLGLALATVSANPQTGVARLTLGMPELYEEVPFIPAIIGLFGVAQMSILASRKKFPSTENLNINGAGGVNAVWKDLINGIKTAFSYPIILLRSGSIGLAIGVLPGIGTTVANFVSYGIAKRRSKNSKSFGKGNPEGVLASEACDNAVASGTLVPTMALGVPGSATAAVLLAMLYFHGVQPGPRVLSSHGPELYAVFIGMVLASLLIIPIGLLASAPLVSITKVRPPYLVGIILSLCVIGAFAYRNSLFDVGLTLFFGALGLIMRIYDYPVIPLVLGLILGPIIEGNLLRAAALGGYELSYFFSSTIGNILWSLLALIFLVKFSGFIRIKYRRASN